MVCTLRRKACSLVLVTPAHFVVIRAEVTPRVRRLARMRCDELGDDKPLRMSAYIAALILADTKHLGSITETTTEVDNDNGGNAAA